MIEVFFISLIFIYFSCLILKYYYSNNEIYQSLTTNRQNYFIKNLFKSYFLFFYSILTTYYGFKGFVLNIWDESIIHKLGLMYSSVDCYGLLTIKDMPKSTLLHHSVVLLFSYGNLWVSYPNNNLEINLLLVYTLFSAYSFLVNYYLAKRIIIKDINEQRLILKSAYYSYILNCSLNWLIHYIGFGYSYYTNSMNIYTTIYMLLIYLIIKYYIILINFLKYNYNKLSIKVIDE